MCAIITDCFEVVTDPAGVAGELRRHWAAVFSHKEVSESKREDWLRSIGDEWDTTALPRVPDARRVSCKDVYWAIRCTKPSAPGPDGMNNKVWQRLAGQDGRQGPPRSGQRQGGERLRSQRDRGVQRQEQGRHSRFQPRAPFPQGRLVRRPGFGQCLRYGNHPAHLGHRRLEPSFGGGV